MGMFNSIFADLVCPVTKATGKHVEIQIKWQHHHALCLTAYELGDALEKLDEMYNNTWIRTDYICPCCSKTTKGIVLYVGKTVQPLKKRMYGYQNPGPTQSTNIKGNKNIGDLLAGRKQVEIYALPDNGLLHFGVFHINLAAGLEDSIVKMLFPEWNRTGTLNK
jgi:hypothetical protein